MVEASGGRIHAVVAHHDGKIPSVAQLDVEFGPSRVRAGVAHRLVNNAIHLVSNDGMHFANYPGDGQRERHGVLQDTILACARERFRQIIPLRSGGSKGSQGGSTFLGRLGKAA